ncbi:hypothetical protein MHLNE_07090 [Moorella humiferrea]|uniref:Uncharacterized protein n=1 Tax=Neomoorella thermoacetica TaxID=1525 RepID=A0A1J5K2F0_NEOTH|nr:hypothetical protein MTJW_06380 [Moorella thermoacetica]OIQ09921.1 hypothetical protein MOOR_07630 [Moorella thermoacetica]
MLFFPLAFKRLAGKNAAEPVLFYHNKFDMIRLKFFVHARREKCWTL